MKTFKIRVEGISALLMHRFPMEQTPGADKLPGNEQAEIAAYRTPDSGELFVPGVAVQRALVKAAAFSKGKGRASLQKVAAACIFVAEEYCLLGTKEFSVDARPVVIQATRGRVIRYRPRLNKWGFSFTLDYDETLLRATEVRQIVDACGQRVGLLDFRPEKCGPFGRFAVTSWQEAGT